MPWMSKNPRARFHGNRNIINNYHYNIIPTVFTNQFYGINYYLWQLLCQLINACVYIYTLLYTLKLYCYLIFSCSHFSARYTTGDHERDYYTYYINKLNSLSHAGPAHPLMEPAVLRH